MTLINVLQASVSSPDELADTAEQLGRATNEIGVYNMITGVFMVIVLLFTSMQLFTFYRITTKLTLISEASEKTLQFFSSKMMKEINIDQARSEISEQLEKCAGMMKFQILLMRELNHIKDQEATLEKIKLFVYNLYGRKYNHFKKFEYNEASLSDVLTPDFNDSAIVLMKELLYLEQDSFKSVYINKQIDDFYSQMKAAYNARLDNL
jgi:hypothetical protein